MANVMVRPMIVETVFVIVVFVLFGSVYFFASVSIDESHYEPALNALLIPFHPIWMQKPAHARPEKAPVSVATFTFSPSLIKSGTRISRPVSSLASLVTAPLVESPRAPGSE